MFKIDFDSGFWRSITDQCHGPFDTLRDPVRVDPATDVRFVIAQGSARVILNTSPGAQQHRTFRFSTNSCAGHIQNHGVILIRFTPAQPHVDFKVRVVGDFLENGHPGPRLLCQFQNQEIFDIPPQGQQPPPERTVHSYYVDRQPGDAFFHASHDDPCVPITQVKLSIGTGILNDAEAPSPGVAEIDDVMWGPSTDTGWRIIRIFGLEIPVYIPASWLCAFRKLVLRRG